MQPIIGHFSDFYHLTYAEIFASMCVAVVCCFKYRWLSAIVSILYLIIMVTPLYGGFVVTSKFMSFTRAVGCLYLAYRLARKKELTRDMSK